MHIYNQMSREAPSLTGKLSLSQALEMIGKGEVFVMHTTDAMRAFVRDIDSLDIEQQTVAYFDCNFMPSLLAEGEWEWYLTQPERNSEIRDIDLRKKLIEQKNVPNKCYYGVSVK